MHPALNGLAILWPLVSALLYMEWRGHAYSYDSEQLFVKSGWWRKRLTIVPLRKIQTVDITEQPLDHPLGLANLVLGLAGGSSASPLTVNAISFDKALSLRNMMLSQKHS